MTFKGIVMYDNDKPERQKLQKVCNSNSPCKDYYDGFGQYTKANLVYPPDTRQTGLYTP